MALYGKLSYLSIKMNHKLIVADGLKKESRLSKHRTFKCNFSETSNHVFLKKSCKTSLRRWRQCLPYRAMKITWTMKYVPSNLWKGYDFIIIVIIITLMIWHWHPYLWILSCLFNSITVAQCKGQERLSPSSQHFVYIDSNKEKWQS